MNGFEHFYVRFFHGKGSTFRCSSCGGMMREGDDLKMIVVVDFDTEEEYPRGGGHGAWIMHPGCPVEPVMERVIDNIEACRGARFWKNEIMASESIREECKDILGIPVDSF